MNTLAQRGHDDQLAGTVDETLANVNSEDGRAYRHGQQLARWEKQDAEEGVHVATQCSESLAFEPSEPPPFPNTKPENIAAAGLPGPQTTPGAFFDPPSKRKKAKPAPTDQLSFL